jgi:amino acid transporter
VLGIIWSVRADLAPGASQRRTDLTTFRPSKDFGGWSGLGFGMVFSILCFAGFEGAATLGEETRQPAA